MPHEIGGEPVKVPFFSPSKKPTLMKRSRHLKDECYRLSEDLIIAQLDEDWEQVREVARMLFYLSDYWRFIEPYYVNIPDFFTLGVQ